MKSPSTIEADAFKHRTSGYPYYFKWAKPVHAIDIYGMGQLIQRAVPIELDTSYEIVISKQMPKLKRE